MIFNYFINSDINIIDYLNYYHLAKSKIYNLFNDKKILVNDSIPTYDTMLHMYDVLTIIQDEEIDYKPNHAKIDILYEDDYFLIINKPKGIIIHDDDKNKTNSLSNMVAGYYQENNIKLNVRFAHRLDYDTTGVIIYCKDILTMSYMNYFISTHDIKREYRCYVNGILKEKNGTIHLPIAKDRHINNKMRVSLTGGKEAITHYEVLKENKNNTLVKVILETGRTHQIRVHFSYIKHPLLGDKLYGDKSEYKRVLLHSYQVTFIHPVTKEEVTVTAKLPSDMNI